MVSVKDHPPIKTGYKARLWCSQDAARKKKSKGSTNPEIVNRDHHGMHRFECGSSLNITCQKVDKEASKRIVVINLWHNINHTPYYDVAMPPEALKIIQNSIEWSTPVSLVAKIQSMYPNVSSKQIHSAWSAMSETIWKKDEQQLPSAEKLLTEFPDEVDVFDLPKVDSVEQLAWGMKKIATPLKGKVVEIGIDATCRSQLSATMISTNIQCR